MLMANTIMDKEIINLFTNTQIWPIKTIIHIMKSIKEIMRLKIQVENLT